MASQGLGRVGPECVQGGSYRKGFECLIFRPPPDQVASTYVLALAVRALEWADNMVPGTSLLIANLVFNLGQGGAIEVSWDGDLKTVECVGGEAVRAPRSPAGLGESAGVTIVGADNPRLVRDMPLTELTGRVQLPPPLL